MPNINLDPAVSYSGDIRNAPLGYPTASRFQGSAATSNPLPPATIATHPHLAPQGRNGMHSDSYATGTYPYSGPLGKHPSVHTKSFGAIGGECATAVFDSAGRLITVCTDFTQMRLVLMHPDTLQPIAIHNLPLRESNKTLNIDEIMNDTSGGAYFHLMSGDKPIIANAERHIQIFSFDGSGWVIEKDYDLNAYLPDGYLVVDAIPDWDGNIWFLTRQGLVGVIDGVTEMVNTMELSEPEEIQNSLAVSADGVFIVSDYALYRFEMNASSQPVWTWKEIYDRGTSIKPGSISQGSGTTPTLLDDDLVAITDNADGKINVVVYHRADGYGGAREVCAIPVFQNNISNTENSLIGYKHSVIVENNFGYISPLTPTWTAAGVTRIDVRGDLSGCDVVWQSNEASQTTVPKLSIGNGLIYLYTREAVTGQMSFNWNTSIGFGGDNYSYDSDTQIAAETTAQAWYLTAIDYATGATRYKIFTGTGNNFNNNWAPITIAPNGHLYVGVLNGIITIKDN